MNEIIEKILVISKPLYVETVEFEESSGLHIYINFTRGGMFNCSKCGKKCKSRDTVKKKWKHLKIFQYECHIHFRNPRTDCEDCGVLHWSPPWTREGSKFTLLFDEHIMQLAREMPVSKIAELVGEHDTRLWRIIKSQGT